MAWATSGARRVPREDVGGSRERGAPVIRTAQGSRMKTQTHLRQTITATVCLLVAVLAVGSAGLLGATIICVGSDGHIDVEWSLCTCCTVPSSHDEKDSYGLAPTAPSCGGDCVDVELGVTLLNSTDNLFSPPDVNAESRTVVLSSDRSCNDLLAVPANHRDRRSQVLASLSTVVILI